MTYTPHVQQATPTRSWDFTSTAKNILERNGQFSKAKDYYFRAKELAKTPFDFFHLSDTISSDTLDQDLLILKKEAFTIFQQLVNDFHQKLQQYNSTSADIQYRDLDHYWGLGNHIYLAVKTYQLGYKSLSFKILEAKFFIASHECKNAYEAIYSSIENYLNLFNNRYGIDQIPALFEFAKQAFREKIFIEIKKEKEILHGIQEENHDNDDYNNHSSFLYIYNDINELNENKEPFWAEIEKTLIELEVKRVTILKDYLNIFVVGYLVAKVRKEEQRGLKLIILGLKNMTPKPKYWFYKAAGYEEYQLCKAFEGLQTVKGQQALFDYIIQQEDQVLKLPVFKEIYPFLLPALLKEQVRNYILHHEKDTKTLCLLIEPSPLLDQYLAQISFEDDDKAFFEKLQNKLLEQSPDHFILPKIEQKLYSYKEIYADKISTNKHEEVLELLKNHDHLPLLLKEKGEEIFHAACINNRKNIIEYLLQHNIRKYLHRPWRKYVELLLSRYHYDYGYPENIDQNLVIRLLDLEDIDINEVYRDFGNGTTFVIEAAALGMDKVLQTLLKRGASIQYNNDKGKQALAEALANAISPRCVELLIEYGADTSEIPTRYEDIGDDYSTQEGVLAIIDILNRNGAKLKYPVRILSNS